MIVLCTVWHVVSSCWNHKSYKFKLLFRWKIYLPTRHTIERQLHLCSKCHKGTSRLTDGVSRFKSPWVFLLSNKNLKLKNCLILLLLFYDNVSCDKPVFCTHPGDPRWICRVSRYQLWKYKLPQLTENKWCPIRITVGISRLTNDISRFESPWVFLFAY